MVAVIWSVSRQLEGGQLRMRIPDEDMVNPSSTNVGGTIHKLLEAKVTESCGKETVGILVQANVHISRDDGQSLHVNQMLQVVHHIFLSSIGRPVDGYLMFGTFVRYLEQTSHSPRQI